MSNPINVLNSDDYLSVKEDIEKLSTDLKDKITRLFVVKESKIKLLEDQIQDLKNKVKNQKSLQEFMDNFDTINKKLCNEIDSINEKNFLEITSMKNDFDIKHKNLKTDILNKIIKFRNSTKELIYKGTDLRYNILKAENNKYLDELQYCSDAYEKIYYDNIALKHLVAKRNLEKEELKVKLNFLLSKYYINNRKKENVFDLKIVNFHFSIKGIFNDLIDNELEFNNYGVNNKKSKNESPIRLIDNDFNEKLSNKMKYKNKIFSSIKSSLSISTTINNNNLSIDSKSGYNTYFPLFNNKFKTSSKSIFNESLREDSFNRKLNSQNRTINKGFYNLKNIVSFKKKIDNGYNSLFTKV